MNIDVLGYIAGILVVISLLPQVIKSWKTKSTQDISLWRYVTHVTGLVLWITYAFIIGNMPVALTNGVGLILASVVLCLKVKYG
ncbi:MAG TPA: SemiSWEET transporter [Candidatus Nanoarchaeia archaeon]|nr:SemiSWEET transporter [Candidatus Nanoarchaeia archaeon]